MKQLLMKQLLGIFMLVSVIADGAAALSVGNVPFSTGNKRILLSRRAVNIGISSKDGLHKKPRSYLKSTHGLKMSESCAEDGYTDEEQKLVQDLYAKAAESNITAVLEEFLGTLPPSLVVKLRRSSNHSNEHISAVSRELNKMVEARLEEAKGTLTELLAAGEIRKLDSLIGRAQREGRLGVPFFNVLSVNLKDAYATVGIKEGNENSPGAATSRLQILQHIYTRCQEEMEKSIPPGMALLNRLLRQTQDSIRLNLYQHYLTPPSHKIRTPDGQELELQGPAADRPPLVPLEEFIDAISRTVEEIRTVENAGATDRALSASMVESCRTIAKEARFVLGQSFGIDSKEVQLFEANLQSVFRPTSRESPFIKGRI